MLLQLKFNVLYFADEEHYIENKFSTDALYRPCQVEFDTMTNTVLISDLNDFHKFPSMAFDVNSFNLIVDQLIQKQKQREIVGEEVSVNLNLFNQEKLFNRKYYKIQWQCVDARVYK